MTATLPTWLAIGAVFIAVLAGIIVAKSIFRIVLIVAVLGIVVFVFQTTFPELAEAVLVDLTQLFESAKKLFNDVQPPSPG